jgi:ubiquinone/menaquinone biosynthesis C-methylase UbiE
MRALHEWIGHTSGMNSVWFGRGVADDSEYRLCGDVNGKRVLELGVATTTSAIAPNSVTLALLGAKAIALDPRKERITALRQSAEAAEVHVECHVGELADLGFVTSASIDLVIAAQTLDDIDDLPRLLRQVHRVLRPESAFVVSLTHPLAAMFDRDQPSPVRRYGTSARSISELFMSFERSNFRIDVLHELLPITGRDVIGPTVLLVRARKQGV